MTSTADSNNETKTEDSSEEGVKEQETSTTESVEQNVDEGSIDEDLVIEVESPEEELDPIAVLEAKVEELDAGRKQAYDRFLRSSADLENFRKRARRDVKDARLDERGKVLKDMLPVIDNLERAMEHAGQSEGVESLVEGVNLVLRQFTQSLAKHQVTPLEAMGQAFDPACHEAVSQAPSEEFPPGTVISSLQKGYMMDGRLLRPALVVVSVAMPKETPAEEAEPSESTDDANASDAAESDTADKGEA